MSPSVVGMAQYSLALRAVGVRAADEVQRAVGRPAGRVVAGRRQVRGVGSTAQPTTLPSSGFSGKPSAASSPRSPRWTAPTGPFASCPPHSQTWSPTIAARWHRPAARRAAPPRPTRCSAPWVVERALPGRGDRSVRALAADQQDPVRRRRRRRHRRGPRAASGPRARSPTRPRSPVCGSGVSEKTVVVGAPSASWPPMHVDACRTRCTTLASERGSGSGGPSAHGSKLPIPTVSARRRRSTARSSPSEPPMYSSLVPTCDAVPSVRGAGSASSVGDACHGTTAPTGAGHGSVSFSGGQKLIGDQARTPELDRPVDRQVVGAVRDVAEQQDDDDEPDEGLDAGPRPAVRVEQPEQGPLARHDRPGSERLLGHRPPSSPGDRSSRSPVDHSAVRVPVMFGWTEQTNG